MTDRTPWPSDDGAGNSLVHAEVCAWRFGGRCDCRCICQDISRNVFDCPLHGEANREASAKYQAEQAERSLRAAERRDAS